MHGLVNEYLAIEKQPVDIISSAYTRYVKSSNAPCLWDEFIDFDSRFAMAGGAHRFRDCSVL